MWSCNGRSACSRPHLAESPSNLATHHCCPIAAAHHHRSLAAHHHCPHATHRRCTHTAHHHHLMLLPWGKRFLLPATLIAVNDVAAYIFGFFFGRTPLIKLSPKKTWEGFIGASVTSLIAAFVLGNIFGHFQWMTCPRKDLSTGWLYCDPGPLFKPRYYTLPEWVPTWFQQKDIAILPVQWHALCLGLFASIIAPFGGFFASGFKRTLKVKDFGDSISGHGGFTDRMDCQMVMAVFAYIYHQSFVVSRDLSVEMVLDQILSNLSFEEQQSLHERHGQMFFERQVYLRL